MLVRRLTDGFAEYELEPSEYHLVQRIPEFNWALRKDLRYIRIAFLYDTLDTGVLHAKSPNTRDDTQLIWPELAIVPEL